MSFLRALPFLVVVLLPTIGYAQGPAPVHVPTWTPTLASASTSFSPDTTRTYKPRAWKKGAMIGAVVGAVLATWALTNCDTDSDSSCPGWDRAFTGVLVTTALGGLIGGMFPR